MKSIKIIAAFIFLGSIAINAQEAKVKSETTVNNHSDSMSYYQKRGVEDAQYELAFTAETKEKGKSFWKEQKEYEKALKQKDRKAYRAYMAAKKETYMEHYDHCDGHCHHDPMFYTYAGYYYYGYESPYYQRSYSPSTTTTRITVGAPSLRLGL
ncbi:hypothetical protein SAMN05192550_1526 [Flavobacterium glycines]|uniref:Uncharacterized protein n=1 Tax=Flavobacterium glycines TaxID=551990 RepID=A0A1B9DWK2_9FLAO|nr:hypothetical protein [Flavobacterium glycines]OCB74059.1 hypothetical protein FBGL_02615 [Flavobacterium glycines]GEL09473.1 hypothetical protein FGL01_02120 [Flavobacterium glycines]SDJ05512.1 hypothetical protein SAMN05192550_1526 [Flavobacterium glycines]